MDTQDTNSIQFFREASRRQLDLELRATRGRSTWGTRKPARRRRLVALAGRPA